MDPYVYVYAADGSWEQEGFFDFVATSEDFLTMSLPAKAGETFYVAVMHYDETAGQGTYQVRVGAPSIADTLANAKPSAPTVQYSVFLPAVNL